MEALIKSFRFLKTANSFKFGLIASAPKCLRSVSTCDTAIKSQLPKRDKQNIVSQAVNQSEVKDNIINTVNTIIDRKEEGRLYAVVQVCGKQFKITNNDLIVVEGYWPPDIGDEIRLEKVLLIGSSSFSLVGRPLLPLNQVSVKATIIEKTLAHTKVRFKYIKRKQHRRINFVKVAQTYMRVNTIELLAKVNELGDVDGTSDRIF